MNPRKISGLAALEKVENAKTQSGEDGLTGQPNMNEDGPKLDEDVPEIEAGLTHNLEESSDHHNDINPGDMVAIR